MFYRVLLLIGCAMWAAWTHGQTGSSVPEFSGYTEAPPFRVAPRDEPLPNYPCSACHQYKPSDPTPRPLAVPHPVLNHGDGRMWCLSCHDAEQRDQLKDFMGRAVALEDAHLVCGQCHAAQQRDWYFGAHGKRLDNWQGERVIYNCTHCHNPHQPALSPRPPEPPPPVRVGLERPETAPHPPIPLWQRHQSSTEEPAHEQ